MQRVDRQRALESVRRVLAAECNCDEDAFIDDATTVVVAGRRAGARRFPKSSDPLIVTMGRGVVISASFEHQQWMVERFGSRSREDVFSAAAIANLVHYTATYAHRIHGPDLKYTCAAEDLPDDPAAAGEIVLVEGDEVRALYRYPGFHNALQYDAGHPQQDVLATVAFAGDQPVGMAGASADADDLWQIGIDVLPRKRRTGLGVALVHRLTRAIHDRGKVPYYSTSPSNIASRKLARRVGFWPAWTEIRGLPEPNQ